MLIDFPVRAFAEVLLAARTALTGEYTALDDGEGNPISAFVADNPTYPLGISLAILMEFLETLMREMASQAVPWGATGANLDAWLQVFGAIIPAEAVAQVTISVTATDVSVPVGTRWATTGGRVFFQDAQTVHVGEQVIDVNITASDPGSAWNPVIGDDVFTADQPQDVSPTAPVVASLVAGSDPASEEDKIAILQATLAAIGTPRSAAYYVQITTQAMAGIGTVFVVPHGLGPGTVVVYPTLALNAFEQAATPWLVKLPSDADIDVIDAHITNEKRRGVNDRPVAKRLTLPETDMAILISPNNANTQAEVDRALRLRFAESYEQTTEGYRIANSEINAAIGGTSVSSHTLLDITPGAGAAPENIPDVPGSTSDVVAFLGELLQIGVLAFS